MVATRRWIKLGALTVLTLIAIDERAGAQEPSGTVTVDDEAQIVTASDGTSTLTAVLTVSGVAGPTVISIALGDHEGDSCTPYALPIVSTGVSTKVTIRLPSTCALSDSETVEFMTSPLGSVTPVPSGTTIVANPTVENESPTYLNLVWGFGIGMGIALAFTLIAWWLGPDAKMFGESWRKRGTSWQHGCLNRLPGLDSNWSWSDSQLSNMTVAAGIFTGLLGSTSVLEKILGDSGDGPVAVVVVAAALSTGLVAAAPLLLVITRYEGPDFASNAAPNNYTVLGVLAAAATVGTASLGFIIAVAWTMWDASGIARGWIGTGAGIAALLVVAHGARSLRRTLKIGLLLPKPLTPESTPSKEPANGEEKDKAETIIAEEAQARYPVSAMP